MGVSSPAYNVCPDGGGAAACEEISDLLSLDNRQ